MLRRVYMMPNCRTCGETIETWQTWFEGLCDPKDLLEELFDPNDPPEGHRLLWDEVKALPGWDKRREIVAVKEEA